MTISLPAGWDGRLVIKKDPDPLPQIEIRKTFGGSQLLIIVGLNGYKYGPHSSDSRVGGHWTPNGTRDKNVRISANGPINMTFTDFHELDQAVATAKRYLDGMEENGSV